MTTSSIVILVAVAGVIGLVVLVLWAGSKADPKPKLRDALKGARFDEARALLAKHGHLASDRDHRGNTFLHDATSPQAARVLIEAGASPDMPNDSWATPLYTVDDEETFLTLLAAGADARNPTRNGTTALHHVAQRGWAEAAERLLASGVEVGIRDAAGNTPLHRVPPHLPDMVRLLLAHGADVNTGNDRRETALHSAVSWVPAGRIKTEIRDHSAELREGTIDRWFGGIRVLVESGANLAARSDSGETPLVRAKHRLAHEEVIAYLESQVAAARVRS